MAAKFIIFAFAFYSASASVCFQQQENPVTFSEVVTGPIVAAAPKFVTAVPKFVPSAPIVTVATPNFIQAQEIISSDCDTESGAWSTDSNRISGSQQSLPVLRAPSVTLRPIESPVIRLPSPPIPGPKVIRHRCVCTKTIVKPQVIQRTINVPRIQRYLRQSYRPVVENVAYQAKPIGQESQGEEIIFGQTGIGAPISTAVIAGPGISGIEFTGPEFACAEAPCFETPVVQACEVPAIAAPSCFC